MSRLVHLRVLAPRERESRVDASIAAGDRSKGYGRWRAATLAGVYVLMAAHVIHWKLAGRTLAPLELNEVMYTLELGIVTAGFIFMAMAGLATLIFGRFFCSWGCHILALEDLSAWILGRLHIRPKPVRSRVLRWVPIVAMLYMFAWPQASRVFAGRPLPQAQVLSDAQGWASFLTTNFWRNLPGPGVTILTFVICGFAIVYMLGSRGFCTYACPYGAAFAMADRFAPGRILARGDCSKCGICTAVCDSHVRVHEELIAYGRVVNPACLKDLDCVAACPDGAVAYGFGRPAILDLRSKASARRVPYDFSRREDVLMAATFVAALLIFRGLYETVPFLLTLAIGGVLAYVAVLGLRLHTKSHVRLNNWQLKIGGRLTRSGIAFVAIGGFVLALTLHSALIRFHEFTGQQRLLWATNNASEIEVRAAIGDLEFCDRWGLIHPAHLSDDLASLYQRLGDGLAAQGRGAESVDAFVRAAGHQHEPGMRAGLRADAGTLLLDSGEPARALELLRQAAGDAPDSARIQYNLAVALAALGRDNEALDAYERTLALDPTDAEAHNNVGFLFAMQGKLEVAARHFERAIALKRDYAHPYFNLGRVRLAQKNEADAIRLFQAAARLDPTYARLLAERLGPATRTPSGD